MSDHVASVISTGGGGGDFERRVGAYFLALLLTNSFGPIFPDSAPVKVHFQGRRLGWRIDDLIAELRSEVGQTHNLAVQVKRTFTLSAGDQECVDTISAAWADFNNASLFQAASDAIVLVTYLGTNRIQHDFRWLLAQAKAAANAVDFQTRRDGEGALNKRAKADYLSVKQIVETAQGAPVADDRIWQFLRAFHVLSFDFQDAASKDVAAVRTILAALRTPGADIGAATTTWSELVDFAGIAANEGRSVELSTLPEAALRNHRQVPSAKHAELARLRQHATVTLRRISDTGPRGVVFERSELRKKLEAAFSAHQVVLLVGAAGSGKSALGKAFLSSAGGSDTTFAFAAEEFKAAHIDRVLAQANIGLTWGELAGLLPLHRKTFLVDGLERLLEASDREAFRDLLLAAREDKTISLVITCRDYYAEVVERTLLVSSGLDFTRVAVGALSDDELAHASAAAPQLASLLANPTLRPLLRNPFLLAKASELRTTDGAAAPQSERDLRRQMWSELVRNDSFIADGMPSKREELFLSVCVERARSLQQYVAVADRDGVLQRLANDNLIVSDDRGAKVAAAHDVLEDWGLIEWFTRRFDAHDGRVRDMVAEVGEHPALRRAYRKWLTEQLQVDSARMTPYIAEISSAADVPSHFKDDTWLAVFQSAAATQFMGSFASNLLENDAGLLKRVLHLVKVGCKTVSPFSEGLGPESRWHVPAGSAWEILLRFMAANWTSLPSSMDMWAASFLEDWAQGVSIHTPYPPGAADAGVLIQKLLERSPELNVARPSRARLIELLLKVPNANAPAFLAIAARASQAGTLRHDEDASEFAKLAFQPFKAAAFARDFPAELQAFCRARWFETEEQPEWRSVRELETAFGLTHRYEHRFFPASSLQGPFTAFLNAHPAAGVRFIVELVNEICSRYRDKSSRRDAIEPPYEVRLVLADGTQRTILANDRLWRAYRGTSVAPALLECALMALEGWLLALAPVRPDALEAFLDHMLRNSNNAATLAVAASVCTAHPQVVGLCGVSILGCANFIEFDLARMVADQSALAPGGLDAFSQLCQKERSASNALPHRKENLEDLAVTLQQGAVSGAVLALLDRYYAELPAEGQRTSSESQWMLALRRMDLRTYHRTPVAGGVELAMGALPTDVATMIREASPRQEQFLRRVSLMNWGRTVLGDPASPFDSSWREQLQAAKDLEGEIAARGSRDLLEGGPRLVAAAVALGHWSELQPEDQQWCLRVVREALEAVPEDARDGFSGSIPVDGTSECANAVGRLANLIGEDPAHVLILAALSHFNTHVEGSAVDGLSADAFMSNEMLLNFGLHALLAVSEIRSAQYDALDQVKWNDRPSAAELLAARKAQLANINKAAWPFARPVLTSAALERDDQLVLSLIRLFRSKVDDPLANQLFTWIRDQFPTWWDRRGRGGDRNFELELSAREAFAEFLVASPTAVAIALLRALLNQVDEEPREFAGLMEQMLLAADKSDDVSTFWALWAAVGQQAQAAAWVARLSNDQRWGEELVRALMLNTQWREGLREWRRLGPAFAQVDTLFMSLPPANIVLESYLRYLLNIGKQSLPNAIAIIDRKHGDQLEAVLKTSRSARSLMDQLLSRLMFDDLPALQSAALRPATLRTLDALVQAGSSNSFLLREDFVTPSGGAAR